MKNLRTPPAGTALLALALLAVGCSSPKTPQDVCDCLNKQADNYLIQHPDLTKAQLGGAMTAIAAPCQALSDEAGQHLKAADSDIQATVKQQMQTCLDALGQKMKAAAKDDAAVKAPAAGGADDQAAAAEAKADQLAADLDAGRTPAATASEDLGEDTPTPGSGVSQATWDKLLVDYESYTKQYAALMRKAAKGDMSAMSEAAELQAKATDLEGQLKAHAGKASPAQAQQFARVQARAMQTMLGAQK